MITRRAGGFSDQGVELTDSHRNTLTGLRMTGVRLVASHENSLVRNTDSSITLDQADRNHIADNTGTSILVNGSDDSSFTGNRDVWMDMRGASRLTITGNEPSRIELAEVRDSVIASNDIVGGDGYFGLELLLSSGNRIEGNRISDPLPPPGNIGFAHSALLLSQSADNEVVGNAFSGYEVGIEISGGSHRNVVSENVISDHEVSGITLYLADGNLIDSNELASNGQYGIELQFRPNLNRLEENKITGSGDDGIFVSSAGSQSNLFSENAVSGSGDDGIDTDFALATITANVAFENGDWGIEAVEGVTDGGDNRAWSNGQPAQCLNVVCGPGPPATLVLSPGSATNTIGDEHCVTATVTDPDGRGTPGETVRFTVDGAGSASRQTDSGGSATFCYDGPLEPGTDEIAAFADSDADGTQDVDEPGGTATKDWVVPPPEDCRAKGKGTITAANGDDATFDLNIRSTGTGRPGGRHSYRDLGPAQRVIARSRTIEAVTCESGTASVFGTAWVTGTTAPVRFRLDLSESPDTYRIRLGTGYDSGSAIVSSGNIRIQ